MPPCPPLFVIPSSSLFLQEVGCTAKPLHILLFLKCQFAKYYNGNSVLVGFDILAFVSCKILQGTLQTCLTRSNYSLLWRCVFTFQVYKGSFQRTAQFSWVHRKNEQGKGNSLTYKPTQSRLYYWSLNTTARLRHKVGWARIKMIKSWKVNWKRGQEISLVSNMPRNVCTHFKNSPVR